MIATDPFETIVAEHYEPLFRFAMSLTRLETDAEDLTQHTFYIWAAKGRQLRDAAKIKTWLFTTLHRAFLMGRRRQGRWVFQDLEAVAEQLPDPSPRTADQTDCYVALTALGRVDKVYQAAVALFYLDDCSCKEIAAILEVPIGTVKSRISRGLEQLREIMFMESSREPDSMMALTGKCRTPANAEASLDTGFPEANPRGWDFSSAPGLEPMLSS
jgi:RNA polymerase sigma-70 factor (ECF subfamily)